MASNVAQDTTPYLWTSAGDDIIYTFSFNPYKIDSVSDDISGSISTGYTVVSLVLDFDIQPIVGEYLYIQTGDYFGRHRIMSVSGTSSVIIDFPYSGTVVSNTVNCYHLRIPEFSLYKGFKALEGYEYDLPYTFVSQIKPSILYNTSNEPYISINVMGLCEGMFDISFKSTIGIDYSMFNGIRLEWDGLFTIYNATISYTFCLNSAITNEELMTKIVQGFYLTPIDKPLIDSQGMTFTSYFDPITVVPKVKLFLNGVEL